MQVKEAIVAGRSFTSEARRWQIVEAATDVIGSLGYAQASYARIAGHAGLSSTRLISYHFADKDELISEVVARTVADIGRFVGAAVRDAETPADQLSAYIENVVGYIAAHRVAMRALTEILLAGAMHLGPADTAASPGHVEDILRAGQASGDFREFDVRVVATALQRSVDGLPFLLAGQPDLDCAAYARELTTLFQLGTQRTPNGTQPS